MSLDGTDYAYTTVRTSSERDTEQYCFIIDEPLGRALTIEEAQDFSAALMMPTIPQTSPAPIKETLEKKAQQGERYLAELIAEVNKGLAKTIAPDLAELSGIRDVGDLASIADCSDTPVDELDKRANLESASETGRTMYNEFYRWHDLVRTGSRCIYMTFPVRRGLTADEGRALLEASQLELGFTEKILIESGETPSSANRGQSRLSGRNQNRGQSGLSGRHARFLDQGENWENWGQSRLSGQQARRVHDRR